MRRRVTKICTHSHDDQSDDKIGRDEYAQVGVFQDFEFCVAQQGTLVTAHGVELGLDEVHRHKHANNRTAGIEALCHVQPSGSSFFRSHRQDIGVA